MTEPAKAASVAAIVLAAGGSSRMGGQAKQLLDHQGRSLVRHVVEAAGAAGCDPVVVVVGANADAVRTELTGAAVQCLENPQWEEGMASSIRCGIAWLPDRVQAALILLCDQPAVSPDLLERILEAQQKSGKSIVTSSYEGVYGPPALFHRSRFPELLELTGDVGARAVITRARMDVAVVDFPDGVFDVDTPEDWHRWQARLRA